MQGVKKAINQIQEGLKRPTGGLVTQTDSIAYKDTYTIAIAIKLRVIAASGAVKARTDSRWRGGKTSRGREGRVIYAGVIVCVHRGLT